MLVHDPAASFKRLPDPHSPIHNQQVGKGIGNEQVDAGKDQESEPDDNEKQTDDGTPDQLSRRRPVWEKISERRVPTPGMLPRDDGQPGKHDDLDHDAEHLPDDGRQQRDGLGGKRQRQREPEKPNRIVRKGLPALPEVFEGFDGIAAREDVFKGAGAGSCAVVGHHRWRPLGDGVDYKWPRAWASAAMSAASALRSDSFFLTQTSHDFPDAVSSPVKAIATMSA